MAKPPPYYDLEDIKTNYYPQKSEGSYTFFVFICSIFVYASIFYIFNLSPSTFLYNNKFWFFISNTLVLIIAADYGAFSSSSSSGGNKNDVYEHYVVHSQARICNVNPKLEEVVATAEELPEVKKEAIVVVDKIPRNPNGSSRENGEKEMLVKARTYRRSKSAKPKRVVIDESKNRILRRSETEVRKETAAGAGGCQEENDLSSMSNEELNRRFEEFIQKSNRQIRLQRAGKFHEI